MATVLSESLLYKPTSDLTYSELPGDLPNIFAMPVVRVKIIKKLEKQNERDIFCLQSKELKQFVPCMLHYAYIKGKVTGS